MSRTSFNSAGSNDIEFNDSESEGETEEEQPPLLKYSRIHKLPISSSSNDAISTCHFHDKVFIFATHSGVVHIMKPDFSVLRSFRAHRASVLSVHFDGQYFATASMDGTAVVGCLSDENDIVAFDFKRPLHSIVLDREYKTTRSFITGGMAGQVILSKRSWLGQRNDTILDSDAGPITGIANFKNLILWTNDSGITLYDIARRVTITKAGIPENFPRPDLYWPKFYLEQDRAIIGWGQYLWVYNLQFPAVTDFSTGSIFSSSSGSHTSVTLTEQQELPDCLIAGLSATSDDILILQYNVEGDQNETTVTAPELKILDSATLDEKSVDEVAVKDYKSAGVNDYHFHQFFDATETRWFLISPKDGICIKPLNINDRLEWFIENGLLEKAWNISEFLLDPQKRLEIGVKQAERYFEQDDYSTCARFLLKVMSALEQSDSKALVKAQWSRWIEKFLQIGEVDLIADGIPTVSDYDHDFNIDKSLYVKILDFYFSQHDYNRAMSLLERWDLDLIDVAHINEQITHIIKQSEPKIDDDILQRMRVLQVTLNLDLNKPEANLEHLIALKDENFVAYMRSHHLLASHLDLLAKFFQIQLGCCDEDIDRFQEKIENDIHILVECTGGELPPERIVKALNESNLKRVSFFYLEKLTLHEPTLVRGLEDEMIELYALFKRNALLEFLTKRTNYDIERAIKVCESQKCHSELVYLLSQVGQNQKALRLITTELDDPKMAIEFVKRSEDKELWSWLIDFGCKKPNYIKELMLEAGQNLNAEPQGIDPVLIFSKIPEGTYIDDLKATLINISKVNFADLFLGRLVLGVFKSEAMHSFLEFKKQTSRGYIVNPGPDDRRFLRETLIKYCDPEKDLVSVEGIVPMFGDSSQASKFRHTARIRDVLKRN